jgi:hypothetical protein
MDIEITGSAQCSSLYLQVASLLLPFGCDGRFVRCIVRRVPALLHA